MLTRSHACVALIFCSSVAFAQEASTPPSSAGAPSAGASSVLTPFSTTESPAAEAPGASDTTGTPVPASETEAGFTLPGGYGYAPLDVTPGQGLFDRKPLSFSTTLQQGYDDNIYGSSGRQGASQPIKGSPYTSLSQGVDLLLSQSRVGLSMQASGGGQYYYDRQGEQLTPTGNLSLLFAYRLTPRAQFSSVINGSYTTQPSLSVLNGLNQSNGKGYLTINSKFDLLYQWTQRVSTDTTYTVVGTPASSSNQSGSTQAGLNQSSGDYLTQTLGQSVRYLFTSLVTGVAEVRASQTNYSGSSQFDSKSYYYLLGCDVKLSRRLNGSFRAGGTTIAYDNAGLSNASSPYFEASVDYSLSRISAVSFNGRYGFNNSGSSNQQSGKSTRVGGSYRRTFSPKLQGSVSLNYDHEDSSTLSGLNASGGQDAFSVVVGAQYSLTQKVSLFANYSRFEVCNTPDPFSENTRDTYYMGATYQY